MSVNNSSEYLKIGEPVGVFNRRKLIAIKYPIEWAIKDFPAMYNSTTMKSPLFRLGNDLELQACLACYHNGSLYVEFVPLDKVERGQFTFAILGPNGEQLHKQVNNMSMDSYCEGCGWGIPYYIKHLPSSYFTQENFIFYCEITLNIDVTMKICYNQPSSSLQFDKSCSRLVNDLSALLDDEEHSDVTLIASGKEFKAHKVILSSRSPVFKRMFENDMKESESNIVNICDLDEEVLSCILMYLYTDQVPSQYLESCGEELLCAAEKYNLDYLKEICGNYLGKHLMVKNAVRIFILAELHQVKQLRAKTIDFINAFRTSIMETEEWKLAKTEYPQALVLAFL